MTRPSGAPTWSWSTLRDRFPPPLLRRALDHVALSRVEVIQGGARPAGRVGPFDVSVREDAEEGACSCAQTQPCAHVAALLAAHHGLGATGAPPDVREAARPAFGPGEPPAPVPAFPETANDLEIPADAVSEAQRAAIEDVAGVVRKSVTSYVIPRSESLALAGALESLGTGLVVYARRPYVRMRASLKRGTGDARLVAQETPGMNVRAILERHGFKLVRRPKSLVHEFEGSAAALHLAAEEMAQHGTAVVLAEGTPPAFEPLAPPASTPRGRGPGMPILFSRRRFEWWTPREALMPLQLAVLQRHAVASDRVGVRLTNDGLRAAERELGAAGVHTHRIDDATPALAVAAAAGPGAAEVRLEARAPAATHETLLRHDYKARGAGAYVGPAAALPALAVALAQVGVHLVPWSNGWPPLPESAAPSGPLQPDDPRTPLAREGTLVVEPGPPARVRVRAAPEGSVLPRVLRVELYRMGLLQPDGAAGSDLSEAGRLVALLREAGFDAKWPRPTSSEWRLSTVRYHDRSRKEGGGTIVHLKGPIPLGRLGGMDPAAESARIAAVVRDMEAALLRTHPDVKAVAGGAMPGLWSVPGGAGAFLVEAALRGASVAASAGLTPMPLGRGVVLVDTSCLPPRLMEFRRTVDSNGDLRPVVSPDLEAVIRRVVVEGLEVDEQRGHYLVPSTRMGELIEALRETGAKVLQRRLAPRGQRYARWEPKLPEDETGARPRLREPFRGRHDGDVPGLRPDCVLDPHQREGLAFILHHGHSCLLADEMGLGKTLQAIAAAQFLPGRVLVVCPASARAVWKQEVHAWTHEESRILEPGTSAESVLDEDQGEKYVILAYSGLQRFGDAIQKIPFDLVILDESHYVKSRSAQRTRLVEEKLRKIPRRLILSGTPVMNEPKEIRTQLAFVHPDEWSDTAWFNRRFQTPWKNGTPDVKEAVLARLRDYLEGIMLRREKRQALPDLPEKRLRVHRMPLPPAARRLYDEQEDQFRDYMQDHEETALTGGMATTAGRLESLKQTALVGKLPLIVSGLRDMLERGEKIVVFCHYREPIRALAQELQPYGVVTLTGSTPSPQRGELVTQFQKDPDTRVFLGQTVAAGVAVTLTAARHAVFTDLEWNPALHRQAMDRIHRKTQTRDVEIHFYLAEDTVEEDIAEVLEEKTQMMDQLLEGRTGTTFGLRDKEAAQREVALRILSRRRRLKATADEDEE